MTVTLDVSGGVATITLASPENRNALSRQLVADLHAALDDAEAGARDGTVRSIVLGHVDPAFCAGADLKERSSATGPPDSRPMLDAFERLMWAPVPTIAAVRGPARAGGIGLMASCDLVVVQRDVTFALTEVRIGVVAALISVPIFRRADVAALSSAFLTGSPFTAEQALATRLVTHVTDDVDATVAELCAGIAAGAPNAVAATLGLVRDALDARALVGDRRHQRDRLAAMAALSGHHFASAEAAEGMSAFFEKRPPAWATAT